MFSRNKHHGAALTSHVPVRPDRRRSNHHTDRAVIAVALAVGATFALGACGSDGADAEAVEDGVLEVDLSDFSFGTLPDEVPAGTRLTVQNEAESELHELVAFRLADGDDRPVDEIVGDGLEDVLGSGPPTAVLLAAPGQDEIAAVGDGTLTEPGRYLILCAIPTGVDPGEYLAAAATSSDGPPDVAAGMPHFMHGMYDDITVTA